MHWSAKSLDVTLFKASLAWRNLIHNQQRFLSALFAVAFAVLLMFTQIGFRDALLDSNVAFLQKLDADLILVSSRRVITALEDTFPRIRLYQAQTLPEVTRAAPFYLTMATWKNNQTNQERVIRVFAFNPSDSVFSLPGVQANEAKLTVPESVLADSLSRGAYGPMTVGTESELSGRTVRVVGTFELGTDFTADGNIIMSDLNFQEIFSQRPSGFSGTLRPSLENVDLGLLSIRNPKQSAAVAEKLNQLLPIDVVVFTKAAFIAREVEFYSEATLGFIFTLGSVIGFIIGTVVVYNIISKDIKQNMAQYGTLRAIGHSTQYLLNVILLQALWIALLGFLPGVVISWFVCNLLGNITGLLIQIKLTVGIVIFLLTLVMCLVAGLVAAQKIRVIDPADIYSQRV